jgi:hypothetical protein
MQKLKNKTMAIIIATILVSSLAISINALSTASAANTYPIPGHPADGYNLATYTAISQGMNFPPAIADMNASANRLLLWTRFQDKVPTHVFIIAAPTPVGVGQSCNIAVVNPQVPLNTGGSLTAGYTLRYFYTIQVTTPTGAVQNFPQTTTPSYSSWNQAFIQNGMFVSDAVGTAYMTYTPDTVGNYTFTVNFLQQTVNYNATQGVSTDWTGITLLATNYTTTLTVQQQPVNLYGLPQPNLSPLPTEYWTRPINQENTLWYSIASNWLGNAHDYNNGGTTNAFQPDGTAPNSAHILWTRPVQDNGIVGGSGTTRPGNSFYIGTSSAVIISHPIIMYGRLYYSPDLYDAGSSEMFDCVDLKTGQLLYRVNTTEVTGALNVPAFGYYYSQDNMNFHGIQTPGWLFTSNYRVGYTPLNGYAALHLANAPTIAGQYATRDYSINGPAGENLQYSAVNVGTATSPVYNLLQWNSSKVLPLIPQGGSNPSPLLYEANVPTIPSRPSTTSYWNGTAWSTSSNVTALGILTSGATNPSYDWNITMPSQFNSAATGPITIGGVQLDNFLWGYNGTWPSGNNAESWTCPADVTVWAINLALGSNEQPVGSLLYMKTITIDTGNSDNQNIVFEHADSNAGVFVGVLEPSQTFYVWNMTTGNLMFTTDSQSDTITPFGYVTWSWSQSLSQARTAYGMLYTGGYSGSISAYSLNSTGNGVTPAWRSAIIPPGTAGVIKSAPGLLGVIADGMIYTGCIELVGLTPLEPGVQVNCLNATTGQVIWQLSGFASPFYMAIADGVFVYLNCYDGQVYAVGQGPTQTTVTASQASIELGRSLVISGTVMDISAGTKQNEQAVRFPNGVPAVSEGSMGQWMGYVYMQEAKPTNITGVPVTLTVTDSNNNTRPIGTTTSDADGFFTFNWKPDIDGQYTVYASFGGSKAYWPSHAVTAFAVDPATPTASPYPVTNLPPTEMYIAAAAVAIIIAIAIVGIVMVMMLRKRP